MNKVRNSLILYLVALLVGCSSMNSYAEKKIDYELRDKMSEAWTNDDPVYVDLLIEGGYSVNYRYKTYNETPLHMAAPRGKLNIVKELIKRGAKVNARRDIKWTPLHEAAYYGHTEVIKILIENGADVNARGGIHVGIGASPFGGGKKINETPLHLAAKRGFFESVKILVENGAKINVKDRWGFTPLHRAVDRGSIEVVKFLLEKGAEVNTQVDFYDNLTPLHEAVVPRSDKTSKMVELLISHGADIHAKNKKGETPLEFVRRLGRREKTEMVLEQAEAEYRKNNK